MYFYHLEIGFVYGVELLETECPEKNPRVHSNRTL